MMMYKIRRLLLTLAAAFTIASAQAAVIDSFTFETPQQERQFIQLTEVLRCPQCQNQSIADSNATISVDLRREVHRMVTEGANDQEVIDFMLARYGEFVLYKPRFETKTLVLWFGPLALLLIGLLTLLLLVRKHRAGTAEGGNELDGEEQARLEKILGSKEQ